MTPDRHALAIVSIVGSSLDVLGSLYLAYDLLGGQHGPLRTLTRAVTYGLVFGIGFGVCLGPLFGLIAGPAHGLTLAWELSRAARHGPKPGFWYDVTMSALRGGSYALGGSYLFGARFGITFGVLSTVGQVIAYQAGIRPSLDYAPSSRPRMSRLQIVAAVNRTIGYGVAGYVCALVANHRSGALALGLRTGLIVGVVTAVATGCMPLIEWTAERMPAKRMGVIGVCLIVIGFLMQSVQYWMTLLDVTAG